MAKSLIRARHVLTRVIDRHAVEQIDDGAVYQEDGVVRAVGAFADLKARHPEAPILGSNRHVLLPGLVNAHHHVGLTPLQLGSPDMPLELWWITRMACRGVDPYLDTLYGAFEMIASGVTTVQHLHGWVPGGARAVEAAGDEVIRAYADVGMRAAYSFALRDQNRLVYMDDDAFVAGLPERLQAPMRRHYERISLDLDDFKGLFETLHRRHGGKERTTVQLAPANLHWCSDDALEWLAATSKRLDVPLHMHLVETAYQRAYAERRSGGTALAHIDRFDLLGSRLTLGHGVWLSPEDVGRVAETGTHICHNCSSNLRLRSGIAPLDDWTKRGINVAIGMDEAGINDDRDMLQELRMVLNVHRRPGMNDAVPTAAGVLHMATAGGAATTPFADKIGTLEPGRAADLFLVDWTRIADPYLDPLTPVLDGVVRRAKPSAVDLTMCAGEVLYEAGRFTRINRAAVMTELRRRLSGPLSGVETERRALAKAVLPHVEAFYAGYDDGVLRGN